MLQLACAQIGVLLFSITFAYGLAAKDASSLSNDQFSLNALHNQVDETSNSDDFDFFADGEPDMGEDANSDLEVTSGRAPASIPLNKTNGTGTSALVLQVQGSFPHLPSTTPSCPTPRRNLTLPSSSTLISQLAGGGRRRRLVKKNG